MQIMNPDRATLLMVLPPKIADKTPIKIGDKTGKGRSCGSCP